MIIFCFLTYNDIIPIEYWNDFFKNINQDKYQVWIHPKFNINKEIYNFPVNVVKNKINTTDKSSISIVRATIQLFTESFNNTNGKYFVFCSQNCIPLHDFNFINNFLNNVDKSIISFIDFNLKKRYYDLHEEIKNIISFDEFVKQQPNMILIRDDVKSIIDNDFTKYFKNIQCPDEHYFINILIYILKKDIIKSQTHFCNFDLTKTQALNFKSPSKLLINELKNKGFLFMRKVY